MRVLCRQFCKAVGKYLSLFQRWDIPLDLAAWFGTISERVS